MDCPFCKNLLKWIGTHLNPLTNYPTNMFACDACGCVVYEGTYR